MNTQSVYLHRVIWHIQELHGSYIAARMEQRARSGEDRISLEGHLLYKRSGVWWYQD